MRTTYNIAIGHLGIYDLKSEQNSDLQHNNALHFLTVNICVCEHFFIFCTSGDNRRRLWLIFSSEKHQGSNQLRNPA